MNVCPSNIHEQTFHPCQYHIVLKEHFLLLTSLYILFATLQQHIRTQLLSRHYWPGRHLDL